MLDFNTGGFNIGNDDGFINMSASLSITSNMYSRKVEGVNEANHGFGTQLFNVPDLYRDMYQMYLGLESNLSPIGMSFQADMQALIGFDMIMDALPISMNIGMFAIMIRETSNSANMSIQASMMAEAAYYEQSYLDILGAFAPGDRIVIDASKLTITKNGQNALHMLSGQFIELNLGPNQIQYSDDAGARNVLMRVTHRDRFI